MAHLKINGVSELGCAVFLERAGLCSLNQIKLLRACISLTFYALFVCPSTDVVDMEESYLTFLCRFLCHQRAVVKIK